MRHLLVIMCLLGLTGCASPRSYVIGRSVQGEAITASDIGQGAARVYLIGLIHGDEVEGIGTLDAVRRVLGDQRGVRVRLVENMNPDGHTAGVRGNARGIDLNRNWPASNFTPDPDRGPEPLSEPETAAVHADILRFQPDVLIVLHSIRRSGPFVNFDGPEPAGSLAEVFAQAAARSGDARWRVVPSMGYPTPGSLGTFAGLDSGIPILTVEFERGHSPEDASRAATAGMRAVLSQLSGSHPHTPTVHRPGRPPQ